MIHLHLHTDVLTSRQGAARVQVRGSSHPVPLAAVERWLAELAPGARITATPVVDLADDIAVDAYEHPRRLRAQVEERDLTCLFPWCGHQGWFDLDHIEPYATTGTGARGGPPPGQTSTSNTGRLCRLHHRVKTHGSWAYQRVGPAAVRWCSPVGQRYHVDRLGTVRLT